MSIAVATDNGLITPIVTSADKKVWVCYFVDGPYVYTWANVQRHAFLPFRLLSSRSKHLLSDEWFFTVSVCRTVRKSYRVCVNVSANKCAEFLN